MARTQVMRGGDVMEAVHQSVRIGALALPGELTAPPDRVGVVLFADGSGSGRHSCRNRQLAAVLQRHRLATLMFDLLTEGEAGDERNRFDTGLLARRVVLALQWVTRDPRFAGQRCGLFGASTGAAAALVAAAVRPGPVAAIVSCGGCPELAVDRLAEVQAPTLLLVGSKDRQVLEFNRAALGVMHCRKRLEVIPGAGHRFDEPGALDAVAELAAHWLDLHLSRRPVS